MLSSLLRSVLDRLRQGRQSAPPEHRLWYPPEGAARLPGAARALLDDAMFAHRTGRLAGAAKTLRALAGLAPQNGWCRAVLGMALADAGDARGAEEAFASARKLEPELIQPLLDAGSRCRAAQDGIGALSVFLLAARLYPGSWALKSQLADICYFLGDVRGAHAWLDAAWKQSGRDAVRLKRAILMPEPIYQSGTQLQEVRRRYLEALRDLEDAPARIDDPLADVAMTNFFIAYQGMNERDTQAALARIFLAAHPALGESTAGEPRPRAVSEQLKLGVISAFFGRRHSIGVAYDALLAGLAQCSGIALTVICLNDEAAGAMRERLGEGAVTAVLPRSDLPASRRLLGSLGLDALLYTDIGMEPYTYFLAFGRYAPLQAVIAGHPITTGIPNIDAFVSGEHAEADGAQVHYTERLVLLSRVPVGMRAPQLPAPKTRAELGLPPQGNLYVCPMKLQKFHPDFDAALAGILREDPEAEIILFADRELDVWDRRVQQRLELALGADAGRVTFMPWQATDAFLGILMHAGVALDTFHFGAGTTCAMAFGAGCPMVTWPGEYMRGRLAYSYYRLMGIDDCIASDAADYVHRAVRIARDRALRQALREKLQARSAILFDSSGIAAELAAALSQLHREALARLSQPRG